MQLHYVDLPGEFLKTSLDLGHNMQFLFNEKHSCMPTMKLRHRLLNI